MIIILDQRFCSDHLYLVIFALAAGPEWCYQTYLNSELLHILQVLDAPTSLLDETGTGITNTVPAPDKTEIPITYFYKLYPPFRSNRDTSTPY